MCINVRLEVVIHAGRLCLCYGKVKLFYYIAQSKLDKNNICIESVNLNIT